MADADPALRIGGISKSFGPSKALSDVSFEIGRGPGPCAGRRERRRQVDAGQDHHRHHRGRRRRGSARRRVGPVRDADRGAPGRRRRRLSGSEALPPSRRRREHRAWATRRVTALGRSTGKAMYARAATALGAARRRRRSACAHRRAVGGRAAVRRDRPRALRGPAAPHPRRADLGADAGGGARSSSASSAACATRASR